MGVFIIKKTIAITFICLTIAVSFLGCNAKTNKANSKDTISKMTNDAKDNIKKDTSIATGNDNIDRSKETNVDLDDFKINGKEDSYSATIAGLNTKKGYARFFFQKFSGIRTLAKVKKNSTVNYESHVENGKLNVVILDSKDNIIEVLETNREETIELNYSNTSEYIIKAIGDEAYKGDVIIEIR